MYLEPVLVPLSEIEVGNSFTINRIPEELEFTPGLLDFLEEASILPGRSGLMTAASPDGTMTIEIEGHHVGVGSFASARILVIA
jgi:DtxR family Mn-dependent transcriptional regulator